MAGGGVARFDLPLSLSKPYSICKQESGRTVTLNPQPWLAPLTRNLQPLSRGGQVLCVSGREQ